MRNLFWLIPLLLASWSCQPGQPSPATPEQTARALFEAFNQHDWPKMVALYAPHARLEDPAYAEEKVGTAGIEEKYREMQQAYPDIEDHIRHIFVSGNTVVVEFTATGTAADGSHSFTLPITSILTIEDGKVIRDATYYDLP